MDSPKNSAEKKKPNQNFPKEFASSVAWKGSQSDIISGLQL